MNATDALSVVATELDSEGLHEDYIVWNGPLIVQIVILSTIAIFGTLGNVLVIITVCRDPTLKVPGNYFIINLAVSDLIITSFSVPVIIYNLLSERLQRNDQIEVNGFCQTTAYLKVLGLHASWYSLAFIALSRYLSLCRMQSYTTHFTKKRVLATITLIWVFILLINFPIMVGWAVPSRANLSENPGDGYYYSYHRGKPPVIYDKSSHDCVLGVSNQGGYTYANGFFAMSLPLTAIIFCYSLVSMEIVRNRRRMKNSMAPEKLRLRYQQERKISLMLAIVVAVFIVCWAPVIIYDYSNVIDSSADVDIARLIFSWLALSNSAMNPGLYAMLSLPFRNGYKRLFRSILRTLLCGALLQDSNQQECSSATNSKNESGNMGQRNPNKNSCKANRGVVINKTKFQKQDVTKKERGSSTLRRYPQKIKKREVVMTVEADTYHKESLIPCEKDSLPIPSTITSRNLQTYDNGEFKLDDLSSKNVASPGADYKDSSSCNADSSMALAKGDDVSGTKTSIKGKFIPLVDQMDDSHSAYTEYGIYLGGTTLTTEKSPENFETSNSNS